MQTNWYILIFLFMVSTCQSGKQKQAEIRSIDLLQESYTAKNEEAFLQQFPKDFKSFQSYFGWNHARNKPQPLYEEANSYIDYWFLLIGKHKAYENDLIALCKGGQWEADAINYFQDKSLTYIKENKKYGLVNALSDDQAQSVLFFLFDAPHPQVDADFVSHLTFSKQQIITELFGTALTTNTTEQTTTYKLNDFRTNDHYFITDIDVNNDGVLGKVVSASPYQGDELFLFVNKNDKYEFALKTINFSEDGGNIIKEITPSPNGFVITTFFPDGGFFEAHHHVAFLHKKWMVTHSVYKTKSGNDKNAFVYVCKVNQNIDLSDKKQWGKLKRMPDENVRDRLCTTEKM